MTDKSVTKIPAMISTVSSLGASSKKRNKRETKPRTKASVRVPFLGTLGDKCALWANSTVTRQIPHLRFRR